MNDSLVRTVLYGVAIGVGGMVLLVRWLRMPRYGDHGESRDTIASGGFGFVRLRGRWVKVSNAGEAELHPGDRCRVVHATGRFIMVVGPAG